MLLENKAPEPKWVPEGGITYTEDGLLPSGGHYSCPDGWIVETTASTKFDTNITSVFLRCVPAAGKPPGSEQRGPLMAVGGSRRLTAIIDEELAQGKKSSKAGAAG